MTVPDPVINRASWSPGQPQPSVDHAPRRGSASPRLVVDWTRCDGHGLCHALAPELIGRDEWGFPQIVTGAPGDRRTLRRIAAACPALALRLETH